MNIKKTVASLLVCASLLTTVASATSTYSDYTSDFTDIEKFAAKSQRPWYYDYVYKMADRGFIAGRPDGSFDPEGTLTVCDFAAIVANGFLGETLLECLNDGYSSWWEPYMRAMDQRGLFKGSFLEGVDSSEWGDYIQTPLNRYEVACILSNLLIDRGQAAPTAGNAGRYLTRVLDVDDKHEYAIPVAFMVMETIMVGTTIEGTTDRNFLGDSILNRVEAATILCSLVYREYIVKSPETLAEAKEKQENALIEE